MAMGPVVTAVSKWMVGLVAIAVLMIGSVSVWGLLKAIGVILSSPLVVFEIVLGLVFFILVPLAVGEWVTWIMERE